MAAFEDETLNGMLDAISISDVERAATVVKVTKDVKEILEALCEKFDVYEKELLHHGSSYERLKVSQPDEFDYMVLLRGSFEGSFESLTDDPSFVRVALEKAKVTQPFYKHVQSSSAALELAYKKTKVGVMLSWTNEQVGLTGCDLAISADLTVGLRLDMEWSSHWRDIDDLHAMVEDIDLTLLAVPKSPRRGNKDLWRLSFSVIEKQIAQAAGKHRRSCIRLVKHLLKDILAEGMSSSIVSYHIKTSWLHLLAEHMDDSDWTSFGDLRERTLELLSSLRYSFNVGFLGHFFIIGYNLLRSRNRRVVRVIDAAIARFAQL